jgi:hypothetical protein
MLTERRWCAAVSCPGGRPSGATIDEPSEFCRRPDSTLCAPFTALANCEVLGVLVLSAARDHRRIRLSSLTFGNAVYHYQLSGLPYLQPRHRQHLRMNEAAGVL